MNNRFPDNFLWGGATADFQYEGGTSINTQDFVADGFVERKRQITLIDSNVEPP